MSKLSIIIPVYNERGTIEELLSRVERADMGRVEKEFVIVDDCSKDGTRDILKNYESKYRVIYQPVNQGKGAAVRTGMQAASGDIAIIQDADLEYDPEEIKVVIQPIMDGRSDVVYGSRFMGDKPHRVLFFWHSVGNKVLTLFSNMLTNLTLTDMETCYKAMNRKALDYVKDRLTANRFGIEPQITSLFAKARLRIYEVGISYSGRTYEEGKKINWKDGMAAFWYIASSKFNFLNLIFFQLSAYQKGQGRANGTKVEMEGDGGLPAEMETYKK